MQDVVLSHVAAAIDGRGGDYRTPPRAARRDLTQAVLAVSDGRVDRATELLRRHDYRLTESRGVTFVVPDRVPDGQGWGLYAVRPQGRPVVVEVPHPRADRFTEHLGAALAERLSASHLLVASARRDAGDGEADVAHRERSVFTAVHTALAERGLPAVQLHGFASSSSPGNDVVVSPGSAELTPLARRIARATERAGHRTCRAWREECGPLAGRRNAQGAASAEAGAAFVHVEVAAPVREDLERRRALVETLAAAVSDVVAMPAPP